MQSENQKERAFFSSPITKGPRVITQGENFTTEYFYRLPSMIQRVLLEKNALAPVTSHRMLVSLPPSSQSEFRREKGLQ
jgi:hypothetical protein